MFKLIGNTAQKTVFKLTELTTLIASLTLLAMTAFITTDIILRYLFNSPTRGGVELVEMSLVVLVILGFGYCAMKQSNISLSMFVDRFPPRLRAINLFVMDLVGAIYIGAMTWASYLQIAVTKRSNMETGTLGIPHYPFYYILTLGCVILFLILLIDLVKSAMRIKTTWTK